MQKYLHLSKLLPLLFLTASCGGDCESLCEDRKECPDSSPDERARDCETHCRSEEEVANRIGCGAQSNDLTECLANLDDLCDPPPDACAFEQSAVFQCHQGFCSSHPDDGSCDR